MMRFLIPLLLLLTGPVAAAQFLPLVINPATGYSQQLQPNNELLTSTPTTASAGFNLPPGVAPSSPINGDLWSTSSGLYVQVAGSTIGPLGPGGSGSLPTISSGTLLGNSTSGSATAAQTTPTSLFDRAFGSTQGSILYRNSTAWVPLTPGTSGQCLQTQGSAADPQWSSCGGATANQAIRDISFIISGGGSPITTGVQGFLEIPFACTINRVTLLADQVGSETIDIWKTTYALAPPTVTNSIAASALPTLTSEQTFQDSLLLGWTTAVSAGDIIAYDVQTADGVLEQVTVSLKCTAS